MINSPNAKLVFFLSFWSHFMTKREAGELLECGRLLPMKGWFSLDQVQNLFCFHRNAKYFMGSCSPLPWLLYPSPVLCLTSLEWEGKPRPVSGHSAWVKREGYATLAPKKQTNLQCTSMLLPLDVIGKKIGMDSQLSEIEIGGEVANIWGGLGRGDGRLTLIQVVRVLPVFGEVLCAVDWQVAALLRTLSVRMEGFPGSSGFVLDLDGASYKRGC